MARRGEELIKWYLLLTAAVLLLWQVNGQKPIMASNTVSFYVVGLLAVFGGILGYAYSGNPVVAAVVGFLIYVGQLYVIVGVR